MRPLYEPRGSFPPALDEKLIRERLGRNRHMVTNHGRDLRDEEWRRGTCYRGMPDPPTRQFDSDQLDDDEEDEPGGGSPRKFVERVPRSACSDEHTYLMLNELHPYRRCECWADAPSPEWIEHRDSQLEGRHPADRCECWPA